MLKDLNKSGEFSLHRNTADNMGFGVLGARRIKHQLFVRYSSSVPA